MLVGDDGKTPKHAGDVGRLGVGPMLALSPGSDADSMTIIRGAVAISGMPMGTTEDAEPIADADRPDVDPIAA